MDAKVAIFSQKDKRFSIINEKISEELKPNEVLMRNLSIPVNEIDAVDAYVKGVSKVGRAAYGEVQKCGAEVTWVRPGDRMIYITSSDSFRDYKVIDNKKLIKAPEQISPETSVSLIYRGCLAHMIMVRAFILREGMNVLVDNIHTATGSAIGWMAKSRGGFVVGLSSEDHKIPSNVCDIVINPEASDAVQQVLDATKGDGCHVYSSGIKPAQLEKLSNMLVLSGIIVDHISVFRNISTDYLAERSLFVTVPLMEHYKVLKSELVLTLDEVVAMYKSSALQTSVSEYNLTDINEAFKEVANGKSRNAVVVNI